VLLVEKGKSNIGAGAIYQNKTKTGGHLYRTPAIREETSSPKTEPGKNSVANKAANFCRTGVRGGHYPNLREAFEIHQRKKNLKGERGIEFTGIGERAGPATTGNQITGIRKWGAD